MQTICVFCGSRTGDNPIYAEITRQLGQQLVARNLGLVYGGGHIGLMGVLADAVLAAGGEVIGVIPTKLKRAEVAHDGLTKLHTVGTMHERKALMADIADGFLALPGGFGTGDELFEILTWSQLQLHSKPIGMVNVAGYFDPMLAWIEHMIREGFLKEKYRQALLVSADVCEVLDKIQSHEVPPHDLPKWT